MNKMEIAAMYCKKLNQCRPNLMLKDIDHIEKGIGFVLFYLGEHEDEEVIAGDLSAGLKVSTARIAFLLNKMEDKGYILKFPSAKDKRKTVVKRTDLGRKETNRIKEEGIRKMEYLVDNIGQKDLDELIRILSKIKNIMEEKIKNA